MSQSSNHELDLTKNQSLVMGALMESNAPMSAYTILDKLRDEGFRAPLQVYRALDKLVEFGLVHRLESLNAFVACQHPSCGEQHTIAFMICETCGQTKEIADPALNERLKNLASDEAFSPSGTTVELRGRCCSCQVN